MSFSEAARRLAGQAGLLLGWRPDDFWRATPDELETALAALAETASGAVQSVDRRTVEALMEMYPDGQ